MIDCTARLCKPFDVNLRRFAWRVQELDRINVSEVKSVLTWEMQ